MTTTSSSALTFCDPYLRRQPPQRFGSSKIPLEGAFVPWRKHQEAHSSVSLNSVYGRRHSLESLSGGSLRNTVSGSRSLRWKFNTQRPMIQKLSSVVHFHYDLVELGPIKVELLHTPQSADDRERPYHCYHQQLSFPSILPSLPERCAGSPTLETLCSSSTSGPGYIRDGSASSMQSNNSRVVASVHKHQDGDTAANYYATGIEPGTKMYTLRVHSNQHSWTIQRTYEDFIEFDKQLHRCVYDRRFSLLKELPARVNTALTSPSSSTPSTPLLSVYTVPGPSYLTDEDTFTMLCQYMERFSDLAGSLITCFPVLKWLELDNRGNHLVTAEETHINIPAVGAAYAVQSYTAAADDELTLKVGDIVSVIDMPPASESIWWRGKLTILKAQYANGDGDQCDQPTQSPGTHFVIRVGFFPAHCVQLFGNRFGRSLPGALQSSAIIPSRPVLRRRGKWATLLRLFLATRPSRRVLKEAGILKERVFGCDLAEHLESAGLDVPVVLRTCANIIESYGIVDGIYRGSGVLSNVQRLRNAFDEDRVSSLLLNDVHCVASVLKMYFRELPHPLLTFQLYGKFIGAVEGDESNIKILRLHSIVQQLPPPHFRTAEYLVKHLMRVGEHGHKTGMHFPNLALVWAPNLLRSKEMENPEESTSALLRNVNTQAVVVEYLIRYADIIFSSKMPTFPTASNTTVKRPSRPLSLACSLPSSPSRLVTLEEAKMKLIACQTEKLPSDVGLPDVSNRRCIDVNGGPSALPPLYHTVIQLPDSRSKSARSALVSSGCGGGRRTLFNVWRSVHGDEQRERLPSDVVITEPQPSSPLFKTPNTILPPDTNFSRTVRNAEGDARTKSLWHASSAQDIRDADSTGSGCFISLDSSIRDSTTRRSFKSSKRSPRHCHSHRPPIPPQSPVIPAPIFPMSPVINPPTTSTSGLTSTVVTTHGLKPCKTTDIDRVLKSVVSVDAPPAVFSLRYETGSDGTLPLDNHNSGSCIGTSVILPSSSPVSDPPMDNSIEDYRWNERLEQDLKNTVDVDVENRLPATPRKASSAPSSLRRPKEYDGHLEVASFESAVTSFVNASNTIDAISSTPAESSTHHQESSSRPDAGQELTIPAVTTCPKEDMEEEKSASEENPDGNVNSAETIPVDTKPKCEEGDTPNPKQEDTSAAAKRLSNSEEKLLLVQLSQTPEDNSPCRDDLQNLFPDLNKIYRSLEELPMVVSCLENEEEDTAKMAASITDLEILELNPEWTGPSEKENYGKEIPAVDRIADYGHNQNLRQKDRLNENGMENEDLVKLIMESEQRRQCRHHTSPNSTKTKWLKDASTSPVPQTSIQGIGLEAGSTSFPTCPGFDDHGVLVKTSSPYGDVSVASSITSDAATQHEETVTMRFISFKEANAVFDRRETLQTVQCNRQDSEEDSAFLHSVYDNVVSSPPKPPIHTDSKPEKPTPRPRTSKLKSSSIEPDAAKVNASNIEHGAVVTNCGRKSTCPDPHDRKRLSLETTRQWGKQHGPAALPMSGFVEQKWPLEVNELANSPLFRKQQQHLSHVSLPKGRNKSGPSTADDHVLHRYSIPGEVVERTDQPASSKSELHLHEETRFDGDSTGARHSIAPSPRSAFSPVLPKDTGYELDMEKIFGEGNNFCDATENVHGDLTSNNLERRRLHSILATSSNTTNSTKPRKQAKVYFV